MSDISIALIMVFTFTAITATLGAFIKFVIWKNGKTPKNAFEYGRSWAAYIAFFVPMSTFNLFLKKSFLEVLISLGICLIVFPLLGFFCGYLYGLIKAKQTPNNLSNSSLPENFVPVQKSSTSPVNAKVELENSNQVVNPNFPMKKIVAGFSLVICTVMLWFGYMLTTKETYICSGEVVSTKTETNQPDKVTKSPIEFSFTWNKVDKKLELSSIGILSSLSREIEESYIKDSEKTSIWDELEKKSLVGIKVPVSNDKNIEFNKSNYPDNGYEIYRFSFDRESQYLITSRYFSYLKNGISHDHKVNAKCARKWF